MARLRGEKVVATLLRESDLSDSGRALVEAHFADALDSEDLPDRVREEIARMLAGSVVTDEARAAADSLLAATLARVAPRAA